VKNNDRSVAAARCMLGHVLPNEDIDCGCPYETGQRVEVDDGHWVNEVCGEPVVPLRDGNPDAPCERERLLYLLKRYGQQIGAESDTSPRAQAVISAYALWYSAPGDNGALVFVTEAFNGWLAYKWSREDAEKPSQESTLNEAEKGRGR
jgi:hypothetical protein